MGKNKPIERPGTSFSGNNRKKKDDDDDDLDDIISNIASKKGIEIVPKEEKRPVTAAPDNARRSTGLEQKSKFKTSLDPWERDNFDELEDHDDKKSQG